MSFREPERGGALLGNALNNPLVNIGLGLLSASGPSTTPVSIGQGLAQGLQLAQNGQQVALKNQLVRARLESETRKRAASEQLKGLLGGEGEKAGLLGLLSELAPGQVAQGLLGQMFPPARRPNSVIEQARFAHPNDPEAQRKFVADRSGGGSEQLDLLLKSLQVKKLTDEREQGQTEKKQAQEGQAFSVRSNIDKVRELIALNQKRREFAKNPAAAISVDGVNTLQRFNQLSTELVLKGGLDPLKGVESRMTDAGRRALFDSKVGSTTTPDNADKIFGDLLKGLVEASSILKVDIGDRAALEAEIARLSGKDVTRAPGARGENTARGPAKGTLQDLSRRAGRPITESDITETMAKRNLTRKQVLDELNRRLPGG